MPICCLPTHSNTLLCFQPSFWLIWRVWWLCLSGHSSRIEEKKGLIRFMFPPPYKLDGLSISAVVLPCQHDVNQVKKMLAKYCTLVPPANSKVSKEGIGGGPTLRCSTGTHIKDPSPTCHHDWPSCLVGPFQAYSTALHWEWGLPWLRFPIYIPEQRSCY
jgi:hypothetical protein